MILSHRILLVLFLFITGCGTGGELIDKLVGIKDSIIEDGGIGNDSLVFNPNPLDFGNIILNGAVQNSGITVRNGAKVDVKIINVVAPTIANFSLVSTNCNIGDTLTVGQTCNMSISFNPNTAGFIEDFITVEFAPVLDETILFSNRAILRGTAVGLLNFAGLNAVLPADVTTTRVTLRWLAITGASSFAIYDVSSGSPVQIGSATGSSNSYVVTGLNPNTAYTYRVNALNVLGLPDINTVDRAITTDQLGAFNAIPDLAASEGSPATTLDLAGYCTDVESNIPQLIALNSQSDSDLNCTLLTSPYRVQCSPNYKNGPGNWSGTVGLGCLLNDYGVPYSRSFTIQVANVYRPPTLAVISGQNIVAGNAITPVIPVGASVDSETISYSCRYDNFADGNVSGAASLCTTLLNQGGGNATFAGSPTTLNWTPQLVAAGQTFELKITATGNSSGLTAERIFQINVGYPPPSASQSTISLASNSLASGTSTVVTVQARDSAGNIIPVGGATVTLGVTGGTATATLSAVTDNGNGTYTANLTGVLVGTGTTVTGTMSGTSISSTLPTFAVTPGAIAVSRSLVSVSSGTVQSGNDITVTLQARDLAGNNLIAGGSAVLFNRTGGTSTGTFSATTDNGNGTYTATFTGAVAGTATSIGATINGVAVTTTLPSVIVTPGVVSLAQSQVSITGNPTSVVAGNSVQAVLRARDAAGNNITSGGLTVAFAFSGGTSTGSFSSVTDNGNGTYSASLTGAVAGTPSTLSATIGGSAVTNTFPTLSVTSGGISAANSLITVSSAVINSGLTSTVTLQGRDSFNNNVTVGGATVVFSRSGGTSTGTLSATTNVGNGTYTSIFTGVVSGTATTIGATINGSPVSTTLPTITVNPGVISAVRSLITVSSATVISGSAITLTLQAKDLANNNIPTGGATVLFSRTGGTSTGTISATTDVGNGTYTALFTGVTSGTATTITGTIGGTTITSTLPTVTVTPGAISIAHSLITVSSSTVASGSTINLNLQARDSNNNIITTGGSTVGFTHTGGTSTGNIAATSDLANGNYRAVFTGVTAGTATSIFATIGGVSVTTASPTVTVSAGAISPATSLVSVSSSTVSSGSNITLTLTARDAAGNNLTTGGSTVVFTRSGGTSTGNIGATTNVGNGTYTATFTGVIAGSATTIGATIAGVAVTTTLPTVTVGIGNISPVTSLISVSASTVASGSSVNLTLTARDAAGNSLTTGGATVVFSRAGGTSTGTVSATTDVGNGTYTAVFTGVTSGTATTITGTINGTAISSTLPTVTVIPGVISVANSLITVSSATVASGATLNLNLQARDSNNNIITTGGSTVVFTHSGGTSTGTIAATSDLANGNYRAVFTGVTAGTATSIFATIGGVAVTTTSPTVTVSAGAISPATSLVSVSTSTVQSGAGITLTLTARDAAGNNLTTGGSTVVFTRSGGTSTGNISATTNVGNGTYTATFTGVTAGTATTIGATIAGVAVTTTLPTVTVSVGTISTATSLISVSASTVSSGNNVTLTLQARDAAGNNLSTGGATVVFSRTGGTSTGTIGATTDVGNGTYTAVFTGAIAGTATSIRASIGGTNVTTANPTITVTPGVISFVTSTVSVASSTVLSGASVNLSLQARDAAGNNLTSGGSTVVFNFSGGTSTGTIGATTDNGNGTYQASFVGLVSGTPTSIGATIGGSSVTTTSPTLTVLPGAASPLTSLVTVSSASIQSATVSIVTLQARDAAGNNLTTGGATVTFTRSGGTATGTFSAVTYAGNGTYTSNFTGVLAGTATTINANINSSPVTTTLPTITVTPGVISATNSTIAMAASTVVSGSSIVATLTARDAAGNALVTGGASVVFSHTGGTSTGSFSAANDVTNGTYTSNFTGILAGTATTVRAQVNGVNVTTTLPLVAVTAGPISPIASTIAVGSSTVSSGNSTTITLQARDSAGNTISTGGSTILFSNSGGTSTGSFSVVNDNTNGTYTSTFTGINAGTPTTIGATIGGVTVTSTLPTITVNPGTGSSATSTITVSNSNVNSGSVISLTLQARDAAGNALTSGGAVVSFSRTGGTSTGTISAVIDNGNGTYSANFTGVLSGTATTITANINGSAVSTTLPTVTVFPGIISTAQSVITLSNATVLSGSAITVTLQARDNAGNNLTTGTSTVVFNRTGGTSTGNFGAVTDNTNGTYSTTFVGIIAGTATTITGTINGVAVSSTLPTVTVVPGLVSPLTSLLTLSAGTVLSGSSINATLTTRDAAGNNLSTGGSAVVFSHSGGTSTGTFSVASDNGNGTYTSAFTGAVAGTPTTISASIAGTPISTTLPTATVNPGPASASTSTMTVASSTIGSGQSTLVTLTARDAAGNSLVTGGAIVTFARSGGTSTGTFSSVTDLGNGNYTATFTGVLAGTATTITGTVAGSGVATTLPTVTVTPGTLSLAQSNISLSASSVASGSLVTMTLTARDAAGNALTSGGSTVVFNRTGGTSTGIISSTTDVTNGTYTATFTGVISGTATTITATVGGAAITSTLPTLTVTPGALSLSQSNITLSSSTVASGSGVNLTLTGRDAAGNALTSGGSAVVFSYAGGTSTGSIAPTVDNGNGTYTAVFTGAVSGSATSISATVGGSLVSSASPTLTVTPGAPSPATSLLFASQAIISSGNTSTLTFQARDAAGNSITTGGATIVFANSGGTSTGTIGATTDLGNGSYTAIFTGVLAGTATSITAQVNSSPVTTTLPTVQVTPGVVSLAQSFVSVTGSPSFVASGSSATVIMTARDAAGNQLTGGSLSVTFSYSGGTSTGNFSSVTDNGNGTYTATLTGQASGTSSVIRAQISGSNLTSAGYGLVVTPGAASLINSTVAVSSATVSSGSSVNVTITVRDAFGNLVSSGNTVTVGNSGGSSTGSLSAVTDNGNGTFSATFTGLVSGSPTTITAAINTFSITSTFPTVTVTPGAISTAFSILTVSANTISAGSAVNLTLTARDANNNLLVSGGSTVSFSHLGGTSTGAVSATTDNANGTYTATFTGQASGSATTIRALINGVAVSTTLPTVTVTTGSISLAQSLVSVSASTVASGSTINLTLTARDSFGNAILSGGETIEFARTGGTSTGSISGTVDNGDGTYSSTFSGIIAGTATTITATINSSSVTSTLPTVLVTPGVISLSQSSVTVSSATVAAGSTSTITLTARDAAGNALTTGGRTVVFTRNSGTSSGTFSGVTDNANGTYTGVFTGTTAGTATFINATVDGNLLTSVFPTIIVNVGSPSLSNSTLAVSSSSITAGNTSTITLTVRDNFGNSMVAGGLTVTFGAVGGTSNGTIGAITDNNNGSYSADFLGTTAGTAKTITATISGSAVTATLPTISVTPGAISLAQSTITVGNSTVSSGGSTALTLQVRDAYNNNIISGGQTVAFSFAGGTSTGNITGNTDNGNGTFSALFTGVVSGTATTISATINGSAVTSTLPTIAVVPGVLSLAQSTLTSNLSTIASGGGTLVTFQAKDLAGNNLTTGGSAVVFSYSGGTSTGSFSAVSDNANGTYTATFTGVVAGSPTQLRATVGGSPITSTLPAVTVTPGVFSLSQSLVSVSAGSVASGNSVNVTLTARDAQNNQLSTGGLTINFSRSGGTSTGTFSGVTDNNNGTYSATFTGLVAGSATTINATINASAVTSTLPTVQVNPGAVSVANSLLAVSSSAINSGDSTTVTLTARDAQNNQLTAGGLTVVFNRTGGTSTGTFSGVVDNTNGTYTSSFLGQVSGTATTITATIGGVSVTSTLPTVTVNPGTVSLSQSLITLSSATVISGNSINLTLQTKDSFGNNLSTGGLAVTFARSGGTSTGNISAAVDNGNGTYSATFTGVVAGTATSIRATIGGSNVTSTLPTVTVSPGAVSVLSSTVSVSSPTVNAGSTVLVTLTTRDAAGNLIGSGADTVAFSRSGGSSSGTFGSVTNNGDGTYQALFTGTTAGTATTINSTINAVAITSTLPTVIVSPGAISLSASTVSVSSATVSAGNNVTLSLTARDAFNNTLTGGGLSVVFTRTGGVSSGNISATIDQGNGTYEATFSATTAGTATTIGATVGGAAITSTLPTITVIPGAVSLSQSLLTSSGSSTQSGSSLTITLQAKDSAGNNLTSGGLAVVMGFSGGTSTGSYSAVTDNSNGTYTATFTGLIAGSSTQLTATIAGNAITSVLPSVTVTPGAFNLAQSLITTSSSNIASGSSAVVTLQARDALGNNLNTGGIVVNFGYTGGTSTGSFGAVNDTGTGVYTSTFTGSLAGTATTITATMNGSSVTSTLPTIQVSPGASTTSNSIVTLSSNSVVAGSTVTVTLQAKDSIGNNIVTGGLTVVFTRTGGASSGNISGTTDNNNGTYTATITGTTAGSATTIGATIGGVGVTSTLPTLTVTPGAFSLANSSTTVSSSSIQSGNTSTVTLTARDAFNNSLTSGGLTVVFAKSGGISDGTFGAVSDNGNGTYTSVFTGTTAGTATSVTTTINASLVTSTNPTITVTPGAFSLAQSTVSVSSATILAGGTSTATLTARDANNNILTAGGLAVTFTRSGGVSSGTFGSVTDNLNGTYSAVFSGTISGTATTVVGSINGTPLSSTLPTITVNPGAISLAQSTITVGSSTVQSGGTVLLTLTTRDAFGNLQTTGGETVVFTRSGGTSTGAISATTDNANGTYAANFQGAVSGTATTISATIGGAAVTSTLPTITVTPGAVSLAQSTVTIDGSPSILASGSTATVRLTTRDSSSNLITTGGLSVVFNTSGGTSSGSFSAVIDNNNGTYQATFTGLAAGTALNFGATINASAVTSTLPSLAVVPGPVSLLSSTLTLTGSSVLSGATRIATVTLRDTFGNQLSTGGQTVAVSNSGGTSTITVSAVTDNTNGTYTSTLTGVLAGTPTTIVATVGGASLQSTLPTLIVNPGAISLAQSVVSVSSSSVQSANNITLTLTTRDAAGNNITTGSQAVVFNRSGGTSTGNISGTTDNNNGIYTATFVGIVSGSATTISATINGSAVTSTLPLVTVIPGAISTARSIVTLSSSSVASGSSITATLQAKDINDNNLTAGGETVLFALAGGGTSTGTFGSVADNSNGTYSANFTGAISGSSRNVSATIGGVTITSTLPSVSVTPGAFSLATSLITASDTSVVLGASITLTLQTKDAAGNNITTGGLTVGFNTYDGTSTGSLTATSDNNNGTYTSTFTGTISGTAVKIGATIGGATVTTTPIPEVTVLPLPVLSTVTESTNITTPLAVGDVYSFDINNSIPDPDNDNGMTYTCVFDRILDADVSGSTNCTTLPGSPTFDTATGIFAWTVPAAGVGPYELKVTGCTPAGCDFTLIRLNVKQAYPTTGLLADLDAQFADSLVSPGQNIPLTTTFKNLVVGPPIRDAVLTSDMQSSNPWLGNGTTAGNGTVTAAGPYRLNFNGSSNYLDLSTTMATMPDTTAISTWIRPSNIASSANGSVIFSNGGGASSASGGTGIEVMQSSSQNGKIELAVAGMRPWQSVQPAGGPFIRYNFNEATVANNQAISDVSGATGGPRDGVWRVAGTGSVTSVATPLSGEPASETALQFANSANTGVYMRTNNTLPMAGFQQFAFEVWFRTANGYNTGGMIMGFGNNAGADTGDANHDRKLWMTNNGRIHFGIFSGSVRTVSTTASYNDGNWHHVVGMYDYLDTNGRISLYINGGNGTTLGTPITLANTGLAQTNYSAYLKVGSLTIGGWTGPGAITSSNFKGSLDEVNVWDRTLSAAEVVARARARACRSTTTFANNTFYNVASTFDNVTKIGKLFVNGVEECSQTFPGASILSSFPLTLGARPGAGSTFSNYWSGGVGEIKVYNTATPGISTIHSTTAPRYP